MIILNFSHPLTQEQIHQIEDLTTHKVQQVINIPFQLDNHFTFKDQVRDIFRQIGITPHQWQTMPVLVNLPGFAPAAALVIAEIHGRTGHFPTILRLKPDMRTNPPTYTVAEIINLQAVRDKARNTRYQK